MLNATERVRLMLRKSEQRVADYVLTHPDRTIRLTLAELAATVGVSQPTVIRFCRALGCRGFREFRLGLAQDLAREPRYFHPHLGLPEGRRNDDHFLGAIRALGQARAQMDNETLHRAAGMLQQARRLDCYAVADDAPCALEARQLFLDRGLACLTHTGAHSLRQAARALDDETTVLAIATASRRPGLLTAVCRALERGVGVIVLAGDSDPLAQLASVGPVCSLPDAAPAARRVVVSVILATLAGTLPRRRRTHGSA